MQHVESTLTAGDEKRHITHAFTLGEGAQSLRIHLRYARGPVDLGNMLTVTLFDPAGFRGECHRSGDTQGEWRIHDIAISANSATPGFIAGALPAGEWCAVINTHRISHACSYQLHIATSDNADPSDSLDPSTNSAQALTNLNDFSDLKSGWLRGDLHAHTFHSDGHWDVEALIAWAESNQLDFVTLSDHNTTSGLDEFRRAAQGRLIALGGLELTTYYGHALALNVDRWIDWRIGDGRTMHDIAGEVIGAGGAFIIAHPHAIGDPICTGCHWDYADMLPGSAKLVEVWNGGSWANESYNELGLAQYYRWLNEGHRLVATAGTDIHGQPNTREPHGFNVIFAQHGTPAGIFDGVHAGHVFLTSGPHLEITAQHENGHVVMMGDSMRAKPARICAAWQGAEHAVLRWVIDGRAVHERPIAEAGEHELHLEAIAASWCCAELRHDGRLLALTNPIFFDGRR